MSVTRDELLRFNQFVFDRLDNGGGELTLEDCVRQWRIREREAEDLTSIKRGLAEADAGLLHPLEAVTERIRQKHGFKPVQ